MPNGSTQIYGAARQNFKKAYDMVPRTWIKETLKIFGMAENLVEFIIASMKGWRTTLFSRKFLG